MILDPFIGTGTTAVAAMEMGHHYIGFEIDPGYIEVANDRIASAKAVAGQTTLFDCIGVPDEHSNIKNSGA